MRRHNFILALLIAVFIGFLAEQTFAQKTKTSKIGKKGKMVEVQPQPPKQLFVEVTVKGQGTCKSDRAEGVICTWKIDRKYSATIDLSESVKEPFEQMNFEPGTASAIAQAKGTTKAKANPAAAFNTKWFLANPGTAGDFDVNVSINDELKETWKEKKQGGGVEEKFIITTLTANTKGRNLGSVIEVTLNRQMGAFEMGIFLNLALLSDAEMIMHINESGEDPLSQPAPVPDVPNNLDKAEGFVTIPFDGDMPNEKTASFEKTFSNLKSEESLFGAIFPESKAATITVKYKFGNKGGN